MKKPIVLLVFFALLAGTAGAVAQETDLSAVIAALEAPFRQGSERSQQIRDFTAEFTQQSIVASIDRVQRGHGTVWFRFQPESVAGTALPLFRWDYREPNEQQILSDGSTLWVYVPENHQVIVSDVRQVQSDYGDNPLSFFSDLGSLARNFRIDWSPARIDPAGDYRLLLLPREESRFVKQIEVVVSRQAVAAWTGQGTAATVFPLVATEVTDPQDNLTRIAFMDVRWNLDPAVEHFVFEIPAGVEQVSPTTDIGF